MAHEQTSSIGNAAQTGGAVVSRTVLRLLIAVVLLVAFGCDANDLAQLGALGAIGPQVDSLADQQATLLVKPNPTFDSKRLRTTPTDPNAKSAE